MTTLKLTLAALALTAAPAAFAQSSRPAMTAQDLVTLPRMGSVAVSPDGHLAVYALTTSNPQTYKRSTALWLLPLGGKNARPVRLDWSSDASDPAFSPDGRLWFLSDKGSSTSQVWSVLPGADGSAGGPIQATGFAAEVAGFKLSPDGQKLAVWGESPAPAPRSAAVPIFPMATATSLPGPGTGRHYTDGVGFVRHWDTWQTPGVYSRVFAYALRGGQADPATGHALDGDPAHGGFTGNARPSRSAMAANWRGARIPPP
jgi:dipeptidyl aminopeptidase/acylaminoacyl peptidase